MLLTISFRSHCTVIMAPYGSVVTGSSLRLVEQTCAAAYAWGQANGLMDEPTLHTTGRQQWPRPLSAVSCHALSRGLWDACGVLAAHDVFLGAGFGRRGGRPGDELPDSCKVYVGNLGDGVTDTMLREAFGQYGEVLYAVVLTEPGTGMVGLLSLSCSKSAVALFVSRGALCSDTAVAVSSSSCLVNL